MKKKYETNLQLILRFLSGSKRYFAVSVLAASLSSLFDLINPKIIGYTVDCVLTDGISTLPVILDKLMNMLGGPLYLRSHLYIIALTVILIAVIGAFFRYSFALVNSMGAEKLVKTIRDTVFAHIERLPFAWYMRNQTGDIIQRCTSDVETVKRFLAEQLTGMIRIIVMLVLSLYFMSGINVKLTFAAGAFIPVVILYSVFFHGKIGKAFRNADEEEGQLSAIAQENLTGVRVVRAFGRESYERERFEKKNEYYTNLWIRLSAMMAGFWGAGDLISGLQVMTVVLYGAALTVGGSLTAGSYIAFISYNAMLIWPVRRMGRVISEMSKAGVSVDRLRDIMNAEEEHDRESAGEYAVDRDISFEHVSFRYTPDSPEILSDVSFTIPAGTTVGILGGTGSGKSTLMFLLERLYELGENEGRITIGGVDIRDIKIQQLRRNIGMVLQEPFLFSRTLAENIGISVKDPSEEEIRAAARIASLEEAIEHFKNGYETYVGERGVTLSGGQKQRAAIAQTVIRNTPIMIFDDSLSAVDSETDAKIRRALHEKAAASTVILISHRITTLMQADQIVVLDHGKVAESGSHEELKAAGGIYSRICDIQSAGIEA